jgi:hypothetical protein
MPVPEREQDTGTVRLISSVTEGSVAETFLAKNSAAVEREAANRKATTMKMLMFR